jgi:rhodanese-related sulfurtransferase
VPADGPPSRIDAVMAAAIAGLPPRVRPAELAGLLAAGALVVDTRTSEQRARDGALPGALVVDRTVLEWRLDPTSAHRIPEADDPDRPVVVVCHEGYSSVLAACSLQTLGLTGATDLEGGFTAWLAWRRGPHERDGTG